MLHMIQGFFQHQNDQELEMFLFLQKDIILEINRLYLYLLTVNEE